MDINKESSIEVSCVESHFPFPLLYHGLDLVSNSWEEVHPVILFTYQNNFTLQPKELNLSADESTAFKEKFGDGKVFQVSQVPYV